MLTAALGFWFWYQPSGTGEYCRSPDGRFKADASNLHRPTLLGSYEHWIEIRVTEEATEREVWRVVYRHPLGADVPDYGSRSARFIKWSADSSAVTIPVAGEQTMTFAVP